jgi:hypothetical protein
VLPLKISAYLRAWKLPLICGAVLAGVVLATGNFLLTVAACDRDTAGKLGAFFGCLWVLLLAPQGLVKVQSWRGAGRLSCSLVGGIFSAVLLAAAPWREYLGAAVIALAAAWWFSGLGKIGGLGHEKITAPLAAITAAAFVFSPLWSGVLLDEFFPASDGAKVFCVWLAPLATLGAALTDLNFSTLPGLYHLWLGSTCPTPTSVWLAVAMYAVPAVIVYGAGWSWQNLTVTAAAAPQNEGEKPAEIFPHA